MESPINRSRHAKDGLSSSCCASVGTADRGADQKWGFRATRIGHSSN